MNPFQAKEHFDDRLPPFAPKIAHMERWGIPKYAILCLLFIGAVYTLLQRFPADLQTQTPLSDAATRWGYYRDDLGKALNEAATVEEYVVVTMRHLLVVALDSTSLDRCRLLGLHCYHLEIEGGRSFEGEKVFMSEDLLRIMWRRILFLRDILARGYSLVFTDTDIMWLRDPFPKFDPNPDIDFQISADRFNGDPWSMDNPVNAGFYMVRSNNRTVAMFNEWYRRRNSTVGTRLHEQDILEQMMQEGVFSRLGVKVRILDTSQFSRFCQDSEDIRQVATLHANCSRTIHAKVTDLMTAIHDWKRYRGNPTRHFRGPNTRRA